MARRRRKGSRLGRDRHLDECFGRGNGVARRDCPCPPECRRLCGKIRLAQRNAPRVHKGYGGRRPYTPVPNVLVRAWDRKIRPAARLCYLGLLSFAWESRWVVERTENVAEALGFKAKRFNDYCAELEKVGLLRRVPMREISTESKSNHHAILLLDLPDWLPGHLTAADVADIERRYGEDWADDEEDRADDEEDWGDDEEDDDPDDSLDDIEEDPGLDIEDEEEDEIEEGPPIIAPRSKHGRRGRR